jgi:hypothetical protein
MNLADLPTLRDRLTELADALGAKIPGDAGMKAWLAALRDYPCQNVVDALDQWLRTKSKMPAPAEIRQILGVMTSERIERAAADRALEQMHTPATLEASTEVGRRELAKIWALIRSGKPARGDLGRALTESELEDQAEQEAIDERMAIMQEQSA